MPRRMTGAARLTGDCLCGGVRFALDSPPQVAGYCHCTRCQGRTGSAASAQAKVEEAPSHFAAPWEPCPDDGLERFDGARG